MKARMDGAARASVARRDETIGSNAATASSRSEAAVASWQREVASIVQRKAMPRGLAAPTGGGPTRIGELPDDLRTGIEGLSGIAMDRVRVHYDSPRPAQVRAHAFTSGSEIHVGPGQEQHLPHEAWHVVQQSQGRVQATRPLGRDVALNDAPSLEREADVMGARALSSTPEASSVASRPLASTNVMQRYETEDDGGLGLRLSHSGMFGTTATDKQLLVAHADAVTQANETLAEVGALVLLQRGARVLDDYYEVTPTINPDAVRSALWDRMNAHQPAGGFRTFADCFRTGGTVGGLDPGNAAEPTMEINLATGPLQVMGAEYGRQTYGLPNLAARAAASFFIYALPLFEDALRAAGETDAAFLARLAAFRGKSGVEKVTAGHNIYKAILAKPAWKARLIAQFGINGAVAPRIGTMLTQFNDPYQKDHPADGREKWNFHWAGIVMVDGSDYVTLENCAVELEEASVAEMAENNDIYYLNDVNDPRTRAVRSSDYTKQDMLNNRWYFKLYGRGDQSFHDEMLNDPHSTPGAITLPLLKN